MHTPENLIFSTEKFYKTHNPQHFFWGFLRDNNGFLHAHSEFNYSVLTDNNTLYINQLSTFHSHVRGYVKEILWCEASSQYDNNPSGLTTIRNCTQRMITEIINFSPQNIDYIVIPCAQQRQEILKKHYLNIGEKLIEQKIVQQTWYYRDDSIFFHIAR